MSFFQYQSLTYSRLCSSSCFSSAHLFAIKSLQHKRGISLKTFLPLRSLLYLTFLHGYRQIHYALELCSSYFIEKILLNLQPAHHGLTYSYQSRVENLRLFSLPCIENISSPLLQGDKPMPYDRFSTVSINLYKCIFWRPHLRLNRYKVPQKLNIYQEHLSPRLMISCPTPYQNQTFSASLSEEGMSSLLHSTFSFTSKVCKYHFNPSK